MENKPIFIWREILDEKQNPLLELKVDENRPFHFIIGVAQYSMRSSKRGQMYLKYGPFRFTNHDVERLQEAALLSTDKLFPTTNHEAIQITDTEEFVSTFSSMKLAAAVNQCTLHHFSSDEEMTDGFFEYMVDLANSNEEMRRKLFNAAIDYKPVYFGK